MEGEDYEGGGKVEIKKVVYSIQNSQVVLFLLIFD